MYPLYYTLENTSTFVINSLLSCPPPLYGKEGNGRGVDKLERNGKELLTLLLNLIIKGKNPPRGRRRVRYFYFLPLKIVHETVRFSISVPSTLVKPPDE